MNERFAKVACLVVAFVAVACRKDNDNPPIFDAGPPTPVPSAAATVDPSQCPGCQLAPQLTWSFEGIFRDNACTQPLAQAVIPSCVAMPAMGSVSLNYVDEVGKRAAGANAEVTLTEAISPTAQRYRKSGKACVPANEAATAVAPTCNDGKACRTSTGALACEGCRMVDGCPDYAETRAYAAYEDEGLGAKATGGGGGGNANLRACCNALASEGRKLGASPEGGLLISAAAQCNALATQGAGGVEFAAVKSLLGGRSLPPICRGL